MTYLLLQTFLLLLSAYFLGAFLACLVKRPVMRSRALAAAAPRATVTARPLAATPFARPRSIDPVQPKIDILPRPEPRARRCHLTKVYFSSASIDVAGPIPRICRITSPSFAPS